MEAVIISKTKMQNGICVGAILDTGRGVRLLDINGFNQPFDTPYKVGDIWDINFIERPNKLVSNCVN